MHKQSSLVPRRSGDTGIIRPDQPRLILVVGLRLGEGEPSLSAHSLSRSHLFDGFLEPEISRYSCLVYSLFLSRSIIGQVELLDFLDNVVWGWAVCPGVARL
jgi:hypothetical protein